jgi:hypothetical protein
MQGSPVFLHVESSNCGEPVLTEILADPLLSTMRLIPHSFFAWSSWMKEPMSFPGRLSFRLNSIDFARMPATHKLTCYRPCVGLLLPQLRCCVRETLPVSAFSCTTHLPERKVTWVHEHLCIFCTEQSFSAQTPRLSGSSVCDLISIPVLYRATSCDENATMTPSCGFCV